MDQQRTKMEVDIMPDHEAIKRGRVEVIGVEWFESIHGDSGGLRMCIKNITLSSIPALRAVFNDVALDVLLFLGTSKDTSTSDVRVSEGGGAGRRWAMDGLGRNY